MPALNQTFHYKSLAIGTLRQGSTHRFLARADRYDQSEAAHPLLHSASWEGLENQSEGCEHTRDQSEGCYDKRPPISALRTPVEPIRGLPEQARTNKNASGRTGEPMNVGGHIEGQLTDLRAQTNEWLVSRQITNKTTDQCARCVMCLSCVDQCVNRRWPMRSPVSHRQIKISTAEK